MRSRPKPAPTRAGPWHAVRRAGAALLLMVASAAIAAPPAADDRAAAPAYRLGPGDSLKVSVYDEDSLTGEYLVGDDGTISFPLLGDVPMSGRTVPEARRLLEARLAQGIVNRPRVSAELKSFRPFYILGEVNKPGQYPFSIGLTIYRAVAMAEGFTYRANQKKIFVTHANGAGETRVRVTAITPVMPGDTVRVVEKLF